jgi:hypothetical protein
MKCIHCMRDVPDGSFCTVCGRQQVENASRYAHFAAHPGEHVFHPGVMTTLFPHLGQQKIHEFRWALIAGLACVFLLDVAGLVAAALLCAAFLVPILYLVYLYEAQVYRDEPASVLGFTLGGGVLLGIVVTVVVKSTTGQVALRSIYGTDTTTLLTLGLLVPLVHEVLKPIPALLLRARGGFLEQVDGLVFGVAAGLGFGLAETVVRFSAVLSNLPAHTDPANWIYPLVSISVLLPLVQGSATGVIAGSLWRFGRSAFGLREVAAIILALAAHIGFVMGSQLLNDRMYSQLVILAWQAAMVAALLIVVRYMLHEALLEESIDLGFSETVCHNCHHQIFAARFCPRCGKALAASPSRAIGVPISQPATEPAIGLEVR